MRTPDTGHDIADRPLMRKYKQLLGYFITHRRAVLIPCGMIAVFLGFISFTGVELMPEMDESMVDVSIEMPVGSELADIAGISDKVVDIAIEEVPEMTSIYYTTGGASLSSTWSNTASVTLKLVAKSERDRSTQEIASALREKVQNLAGAEISVTASGTMNMSAMTGEVISVTLRGADHELLLATAEDLTEKLQALPGAVAVASSAY